MLTKGPLAAASQQLLLCLLLLASATARASNVTYYATPSKFADVGVFAFLPGFTLRDPTTAVFDPVTATWHVFCTHIHGRAQPGYPGVVWHWSLNSSTLLDPNTSWTSEGVALNASHVNGTFDAAGVFTPAIVRECTTNVASKLNGSSANDQSCKWYLWYGGVPNEDSAHTENVGLALADSPWGPFVRYEHNPVFSYTDANTAWCNDGSPTTAPARVDEIKPSVVNGSKVILVKSVCTNATALPVPYFPASNDSWAPPYMIPNPAGPIFGAKDTCQEKGFEEPTIYLGPDGFLHFQGHDHGNCGVHARYAHYINTLNEGRGDLREGWEQVAPFGPAGTMEPVPIPASGDGGAYVYYCASSAFGGSGK
eukprot:INCI17566.8.p1 GENE.INCI17566.8~~INCI17566.8.p1  ORF type:complete len:367 (-),score=40.49 INCI17566.8:821-1921(-)